MFLRFYCTLAETLTQLINIIFVSSIFTCLSIIYLCLSVCLRFFLSLIIVQTTVVAIATVTASAIASFVFAFTFVQTKDITHIFFDLLR